MDKQQQASLHHVYQQRSGHMQALLRRLLLLSFSSLFLLSLAGVWLRLFPILPPSLLLYKNILRGHSHFALGGWVIPMLLVLILKSFTQVAQGVAYKHWRNITAMLLLAAYGMLLSFPVQGYGAVSIFFSTLSVVAGFYLAVVVWKAARKEPLSTAYLYLKWSLVYLTLSATGPFAVGFFAATGKGGTPLYYDAVYYYLHFQYNGFFTFAVLAIFYQCFCKELNNSKSRRAFLLLNLACVPSFFLSVLWHQPGILFNFVGGGAALLQAAALYYLWHDVKKIKAGNQWTYALLLLSMLAFSIKIILQLGNAVPVLAQFAYHYRNVTIAYLHLVLLGFVTLFCFAAMLRLFTFYISISFKTGLCVFITVFIVTQLLLVYPAVGSVLGLNVPESTVRNLLMGFSVFFPVGILTMLLAVYHQRSKTN